MEKPRFIFEQEMTKEQLVEVILKVAREHGVKVICESKNTPKGPHHK